MGLWPIAVDSQPTAKAWVYRRRALTRHRSAPADREGVIDQDGLWTDQLPSAEPTSPGEATVPQPEKPIHSEGNHASP